MKIMSGSIHSGLLNKIFNKFEDLYSDIFINKSKYHLIENKVKFHQNFGNGGISDDIILFNLH